MVSRLISECDCFRYTPQNVELDYHFKPFIPDYIPSIGDVDAFLKVCYVWAGGCLLSVDSFIFFEQFILWVGSVGASDVHGHWRLCINTGSQINGWLIVRHIYNLMMTTLKISLFTHHDNHKIKRNLSLQPRVLSVAPKLKRHCLLLLLLHNNFCILPWAYDLDLQADSMRYVHFISLHFISKLYFHE